MTRLQGPAVEALAITFQTDWYVETNSSAKELPDLTGEQPIHSHGRPLYKSCLLDQPIRWKRSNAS